MDTASGRKGSAAAVAHCEYSDSEGFSLPETDNNILSGIEASPGSTAFSVKSGASSKRSGGMTPSPATQTLNHLSQTTIDLRLPGVLTPNDGSAGDDESSAMPSPPARFRKDHSPSAFSEASKISNNNKDSSTTYVEPKSPPRRSPTHYTRKSIPILHITEDNAIVAEFTSIRHASSQTGEKRGDVVVALQKNTLLGGHYFRYKDPTLSSCQKPKKIKPSHSSSNSSKRPSSSRSSKELSPRKAKCLFVPKSKRSGQKKRKKTHPKSPSPVHSYSRHSRHSRSHSLGSAASLLVDFKKSKSPETLEPDIPLLQYKPPAPEPKPMSPWLGKNLLIPKLLSLPESIAKQILPFRLKNIPIPPNDFGKGLGMTVSRSTPPPRLGQWSSGCRVDSMDSDGWARQHGVTVSDWIWDLESKSLMTYDDFLVMARAWADQTQEPLHLSVLRWDESAEMDHAESQLTEISQAHRTETVSPLRSLSQPAVEPSSASKLPAFQAVVPPKSASLVKPKAIQAPLKTDSPKDILSLDCVPFCGKCNDGKTRVHHVWCPKSAHFKKSGAKDILHRITEGVKRNCPVCLEEYKSGKPKRDQDHTEECLAHQLVLHEEEHPSQKHDAVVSHPLPLDNVKKPRPWDGDLQPSDCEEESDNSVYPDPNNGAFQKSILLPSKSKISKTRLSTNARKEAPLTRDTSTRNTTGERRGRANTVTPTALRNEVGQKEKEKTADEFAWEEDTSVVEFGWVPCPNPWGALGYQEGDVVLYSSNHSGIGHHDVALPSNRFEENLFAGGSRYAMTHHSPQDGIQGLILRRDPMATMSWGFTWYRHEFGGACLVDTVDLASPAASALFIGDPSIKLGSGLKPKDMLLAVNNKPTGGMTEVALQLELDTSGSELVLIVSRFKYEKAMASRLAVQDSQSWKAFDAEINDFRVLDWIEAGGNSTSEVVHNDLDMGNCNEPDHKTRTGNNLSGHMAKLGTPVEQQALESAIADKNSIHSSMNPSQLDPSVNAGKLSNKGQRKLPLASESSLFTPMPVDRKEKLKAWLDEKNAVLGCVCGKIHEESVPVFWIQCDSCDSWYNVSSTCVNFTEEEAEFRSKWKCWGCEESKSETSPQHKRTSLTLDSPSKTCQENGGSPTNCKKLAALEYQVGKHRTNDEADDWKMQKGANDRSRSPQREHACEEALVGNEGEARHEYRLASTKNASDSSVEVGETRKSYENDKHRHRTRQTGKLKAPLQEKFSVGDFVMVQQHAWPGVNNETGIAQVLDIKTEINGAVSSYQVKYVVGKKRAEILPSYLRSHKF